MFDAKSLLDKILTGSGNRAPGQGGSAAGAPGLEDILGQLGQMLPAGGQQGQPPGQASAAGPLGGLGDILGRLQEQAGQAAGAHAPGGTGGQSGAPGGLMDILGQVLGQATSGVREGAGKIGHATGAEEALGRLTGGRSIDEIMAQVKDYVANNQFGAGAAAGGLGAVILGTKTGRSLASNAATLGALALIGGLAYKAYTNYQAGKPLISGADAVAAAPEGSGFEPDAINNEAAILYIRAMIAAAAADGRVDKAEMEGIVGHLRQAGFDNAAEEFIAGELNAPATTDDIAQSTIGPEQALQVYTAARLAITLDSPAEQQFLADLARKLDIPAELAAHVEAAARNQG